MVKFAFQFVVRVHWFRLAPNGGGTLPAISFVVARSYAPPQCHLGAVGEQPLSEGEECIVAFHERVAQIGTSPCSVVAVMYFPVAQVQHKCTFVNDIQSHHSCGTQGQGRKQEKEQ